MALLSLSIDLSGSTHAKQAIVEISGGDESLTATLYRRYLKMLYGVERDLYALLAECDGIDLANVFLVKLIGDEWWFVYDIDHTDSPAFNAVVLGFVDALLRLFEKERYLSFHAPEKHSLRPMPESKALRVFNLPIKATLDLLINPVEANRERYEYLKDIVLPADERQRRSLYAIDRNAAEICERLNLGAVGMFEDGHPVHVRRDYIGLEVDRFFRMTSCCRPLLLGMGRTLMAHVDQTIQPVSRDLEHIAVKTLAFGPAWAAPKMKKYVIREAITPGRLKGISHGYEIYHLFGERSLGKGIYAPPPGMEMMMEATRAFLAEHGFYALGRDSLLP